MLLNIGTSAYHFYSRASCEARLEHNGITNFHKISTHAPRVRRDCFSMVMEVLEKISTHAPRVRRDCDGDIDLDVYKNFYSRASCEARPERGKNGKEEKISTHAPRVRRDGIICIGSLGTSDDFYSRASCEARPESINYTLRRKDFYSRASCEARRRGGRAGEGDAYFYSRASCEARRCSIPSQCRFLNFYSRASCEARPGCRP